MALNPLQEDRGVADGGDANIAPSSDASWQVQIIVATGAADVYYESDQNTDGTFVGTKVDSIAAAGDMIHGSVFIVSHDGTNVTGRVRVNNTSGGTIDVFAFGDDGI